MRLREPRRITPRVALLSLWIVVKSFWVVLVRRLLKGPRHPGWGFRYELIATSMRVLQQRLLRMPVTELRRHMLSTRVHASVKPIVQHERTHVSGLYAELFTPRGYDPAGGSTILYFHGGGYIACSPATHRDLVSRIAAQSHARCICVDYRKAPEHPFPLPIEDCEAAYRALLADGTAADKIILAGDSAGGGLVLAVLLRAKAAGLPLPDAAVLLSPWVDLSCSGDSVQTNADYDYLSPEGLEFGVANYLQGQDPRHPHASPVHGELSGLPPMLLLTGAAELFMSENLALAERARAHGVELVHHVEQGMVHVWSLFASIAPGADGAIERIGQFVRARAEAQRAAPPRTAYRAGVDALAGP